MCMNVNKDKKIKNIFIFSSNGTELKKHAGAAPTLAPAASAKAGCHNQRLFLFLKSPANFTNQTKRFITGSPPFY
jgi:hypothetical protein